jgi:CRP/FNR family cyclic AMP-dependent transcriptional regulator
MVHTDDVGVQQIPKGTVLFKQGDKGDAAYIVNAGAIGLYREALGRKIPLATVRRGELFGEMAVIDGTPRMATAFTLEDSALMVIPVEVMAEKMKKADSFIRAMIHMLTNNLRHVHDTYSPKSRSLVDAVNSMQRQIDMVTRFTQNDLPPKAKADIEQRLKALDVVLKELRRIGTAHREDDRREDSLPSEADLPT